MTTLHIAVAATLLLSGCETINALRFTPATSSGTIANQEITVGYLTDLATETSSSNIPLTPVASPELKEAAKSCLGETRPAPEFPVSVIPLAAAGGQLVFQLATDALAARVKAVRDRAQRTYQGQATVDTSVLRHDSSRECFVLTRTTIDPASKEPKALGLALLLRKEVHGDTITLVPTYLEVENTMAETGAAPVPRIDLSVAMIVKGLVEGPGKEGNSGKLSVAPVAEARFPFPGIGIGEKPLICRVGEKCRPESEVIAPLSSTKRGATITIAVVETGSGFGNVDTALAEIKALQTALGPAISTTIKTYLERTQPTDSP
jgi:hypothetical protein